MRVAAALAIALAAAAPAHADDDDFGGATVVYARGGALYRADPRGHHETKLADLGSPKAVVRALRSDAAGKVLLAQVDATWSWIPLDGTATQLAPLPCADGPAQLAENGATVLCAAAEGSQIIVLATGTIVPVDVPTAGSRLLVLGDSRKLVWADSTGVWTAPPAHTRQKTKVAPEPPLRDFLPSPDGTRALAVYADEVYTDTHHKEPAEMLMGFALDGQAARRKAIKAGAPVEWSHDSQWVLVQDRTSACLMRATGGEYKCWHGYTAASIAPDGKFALVLSQRDGAPALLRVRLMGSPYTESPVLVTKGIDPAAVWVPAAP